MVSVRPAKADFVRWVGGDGFWGIDTNWNPVGLPGPNDPVLVDQGLFTATHDEAAGNSVVAQIILENKMTVVLSGGTLSALGGNDPDQYFTSLGVFGTSRYSQTGGVLEAPLGIDVSGASRFDISAGEITAAGGETPGINIASTSSYTQTGGTNHLSLSLGGGTALISAGQLGDSFTSSVRVLFGGTLTQQGGVVSAHSLNLDTAGHYEMTAGTVSISTINIGRLDKDGSTLSIGTFAQSGGSVSVDSALTINGGKYVLGSDGSLNVSSPIRIGTDMTGVPSDALLDSAGTITFDDFASSITGNGTFSQRGTMVKAGVNSGTLLVNTTFVTSGGTIDVQNGGVDINGNVQAMLPTVGTDAIVKTGPGILKLAGAQNWDAGTRLQLLGGETIANTDLGAGAARPDVRLNGATLTTGVSQTLGMLQIDAGGFVRITQGSASTLMAGTLQIDSDNGATLDLADNSAMFFNTSRAAVQSLVQHARNGGTWDSAGLTSSTAAAEVAPKVRTLAVMTGSEYLSLNGPGATFNLYTVAEGDVLVKFTYYGDTDLNGAVNFDDYSRVDNGFNNTLTGWLNGDFDYNDQVNFDDYALIDLAFNSQAETLARAMSYLSGDDRTDRGMDAPSLRMVEEHFAQFGDDYARQFLNSVPEPASVLSAAAMVGMHLLHRRRRSS